MQNRDVSKYVGKKIREYRQLRDMTQKELGQKIGVKHNTISSYENGINEPEQDILFAIAKALDVSVNDLFPSIKDYSKSALNECNVEEATQSHIVSNELAMLPIVGRISCGQGSLAFENIEGYEPTPKSWLIGGDYFYLRAKGNSMINARIFDGDLLLIKKQEEVEDGEIAVVCVEDEAMLKRIYRKGGLLVLQSDNPEYPAIVCDPEKEECQVVGKLKKIVISV